jgi:group I intron endonuclease
MIVYKITNIVNGKVYIGQTVRTLKARWAQHCSKKGCLLIYNAIKKYGKDSFTIEQIHLANSLNELNQKETEYIKIFNSLYPNGYNLNTGGGNKKWSQKSKGKMSKSHMGKKLTESHKEAIRRSVKKVFTENPERLKNSHKALKDWNNQNRLKGYHPKRGKRLSEESKKRISEAKKGSKNPMFGKTISQSQKEAIRKALEKRKESLPKVLCHQNNTVYKNVHDAAQQLGLRRASVSNVITGRSKTIKGYSFEYIKEGTSNEQ